MPLFEALISGVMIGWWVRLVMIPFKFTTERKRKIMYYTMIGAALFMWPHYLGWYQVN